MQPLGEYMQGELHDKVNKKADVWFAKAGHLLFCIIRNFVSYYTKTLRGIALGCKW